MNKKQLAKTWTMRDGTVIKISDMSDRHLINTLNYLWRNAEELRTRAAFALDIAAEQTNGEMAAYYLEQDANHLYEMEDIDYLSTREDYCEMLAEAKRRGLSPRGDTGESK